MSMWNCARPGFPPLIVGFFMIPQPACAGRAREWPVRGQEIPPASPAWSPTIPAPSCPA